MEMVNKHFIEPCKRFPIAVMCSLAFFVTLLINFPYEDREIQSRLLGFFLANGFFFITLQLVTEHLRLSIVKNLIIGLSISSLLFFAFATTTSIPISFAMLGGAAFISMFASVVTRSNASEMDIWNFSYIICKHIAFTFLLSAVLFAGVTAIVKSLDFLFGIDFYRDIYEHIWFFMATLFPAVFAMSGIPNVDEYAEEPCIEGLTQKAINFLVLPLFFVYTLIWYGYFATITLTWSLPQGEVSIMALLYGGAGVFAYLVVYPISEKFKLIALFKKYFFMLLIAPCILLSLAIFVRVSEYGITESRYFVLLGLLWFMILVGVSFVKFKGKPLRVILLSCVGLLILASIGPWNAANISELSQVSRLKALFIQYDVFDGDAVRVSEDQEFKASIDDAAEMESILRYLIRSQKTSDLEQWLVNYPNAKSLLNNDRSYKASQTILGEIGITNAPRNGHYRQNGRLTYGEMYGQPDNLFKVNGFDYFFNYQQGYVGSAKNSYNKFGNGNVSVEVKFDKDKLYLSVVDQKVAVIDDVSFDLFSALEGHVEKDGILFELNHKQGDTAIKVRVMGLKLEKKDGKRKLVGFNGQILFRY